MKLGQWAEQQALTVLEEQGYVHVQSNYHSRFGEIDLIVRKGRNWFLLRSKHAQKRVLRRLIETISYSKQRKIAKTAMLFLQDHPHFQQYYCRFDVICFDFFKEIAKTIQQDFSKFTYDQQWIENAFTFDQDFINL